jgi:tight adherence protein C
MTPIKLDGPMSWLIVLLWVATAAGFGAYAASAARHITYVTLADGRKRERRLPFLFRLLIPLTPNVAPLFSRALFAARRKAITRRIVSAGYEDLVSAEEFLGLRLLMPLMLGPFWMLMVRMAAVAGRSALLLQLQPGLFAIGVLWLALYPGLWLTGAVQARHREIQRALPFVLDLLTLSVEAGMDFMSSLQRNVERRAIDALGEELIRVVREIQVGKTRRVALRDMSERVNLSDLRSVVNALVQADELGVSIGSILHIQADQMRQRRFERAERLANEAPVKMLFPLMFFIFPSVFLVLLGPVIGRMIEQGF